MWRNMCLELALVEALPAVPAHSLTEVVPGKARRTCRAAVIDLPGLGRPALEGPSYANTSEPGVRPCPQPVGAVS